ncbi:MAG: polyphosphate kinase 1 [Thermomicrobiales bacterium]
MSEKRSRRRGKESGRAADRVKTLVVAGERVADAPKRKGAKAIVADRGELPPLEPALFINRELSWLEFNSRVLAEAEEEANPLLERVKFAAIFSSNLDEFFMIRVAGIKRKIAAGIALPGPDGRTPTQQLQSVREMTQAALDRQAGLIRNDLLPLLARAGIAIVPYAALTRKQQALLTRRFEEEIFPILTPQAIDRGRRFPHVSNLSLNLIAALELPEGSRYARIKIPATLPRFVPVEAAEDGSSGKKQVFTWLEDVVAANLPRLFPGARVTASHVFHVTRDSDIELDEDDGDEEEGALMSTMRESIAKRAFGPVVRLMVTQDTPDELREWLVEHLHADRRDLYVVDGPLACDDFMQLGSIDRPDLKFEPFTPAAAPGLTAVPGQRPEDVFAEIRDHDILVHHPYQSFGAFVDFLRAAAADPDVVAIKQTLYRLGKDSPLIPALIEARDDDTQVAVLVELKARFDEENNISWAEELERHGVHVAYGLTGLKTHCKATLIVRREAGGLRRYVHLATGNYNASTARIYEDYGYFSAREDLGADVSELFNVLTGFAQQRGYRSLWVAPDGLRLDLLTAIEDEIETHRRYGGGHLQFKVNALVDRLLIRALYKASQAGVKVDLIVRGACCLRPGVPGWSENIRVISVVGRFLEHSRVYAFHHGGERRVYLGSADLMERNLDRRVEVVFPVEDASLASKIRDEVMPAYFRDTTNAWELGADGAFRRIRPAKDEVPFDIHAWLMERYRLPADWMQTMTRLAGPQQAILPTIS